MVEAAHAAAKLVAVVRPQRLHHPADRAHSLSIHLRGPFVRKAMFEKKETLEPKR